MTVAKPLAEFVGTFFLVLVIGMTAFDPSLPSGLAPVAVASVLTAMIFATSGISGAHFNPVVTLAFAIRGSTPRAEIVPFILVPLGAAFLAGLAVVSAAPAAIGSESLLTTLELKVVPTIVFETLFTFALVFVSISVAIGKPFAQNQACALGVGFVVLAGAYVAGPVSGAAFNPAVTLARGTMGIADWTDVRMQFGSQLAGAMLALAAFAIIDREATGS